MMFSALLLQKGQTNKIGDLSQARFQFPITYVPLIN